MINAKLTMAVGAVVGGTMSTVHGLMLALPMPSAQDSMVLWGVGGLVAIFVGVKGIVSTYDAFISKVTRIVKDHLDAHTEREEKAFKEIHDAIKSINEKLL